jgi:hypothetical protein
MFAAIVGPRERGDGIRVRLGDNRGMRIALFLTALAATLVASSPAFAQSCAPTSERDALRQIAQCLAGADCRGRTVIERQNLGPGCESEIEVWGRFGNGRSAAIRDRKMCLSRRKAQPDPAFVHGLLLPLSPLCGVEDPSLADERNAGRGLWSDAWTAARTRLPEGEIVLAINPPNLRSLNHLHIHILRGNGRAFAPERTLVIDDLDDVWRAARAFAATRPETGGGQYGIAVRRRGERYEVVVEPGLPARRENPEYLYGVAED